MAEVSWNNLMENAGGDFEPLPDGNYDLEVDSVEAKESSSGKLMFAVTAVVTSGPSKNRKIWTNLVVSPESAPAMGMFFANMKSLGLDRDFFATEPAPEVVAQALTGRRFTGTVKQRTWQNQLRNEIAKISPPSTPQEAVAPVQAGVPSDIPPATSSEDADTGASSDAPPVPF